MLKRQDRPSGVPSRVSSVGARALSSSKYHRQDSGKLTREVCRFTFTNEATSCA